MVTKSISSTLRCLPLQASIPGYESFFGTYLFCGDKKAIVDVGPTDVLPSLLSVLADQSIGLDEIDYIILTHIHIDHAGGVGAAAKKMKNAKIVAHERARPHLINPARLWEASIKTLGELANQYGSIEPVSEERIISAEDLMKLDLGRGLQLEIHLTPGHAPHHLSLLDRSNGVLLVGEAAGVCQDSALRPSTPPPFRFEEALSSIDRLIALEPMKVCYAHLGCYDDGIDLLKLAKQQLVEWREAVKLGVKDNKSPEEIFKALQRNDRSLDYLSKLNRDEYERECKMLINSVIGLTK